MLNGTLVHEKLIAGENHVRTMQAANTPPETIIRWLYLQAVSRPPGEAELTAALKHIQAAPDAGQALEDICWALLNSKEFLFQH